MSELLGRRIALDIGTVRVGIAQSDTAGISLTPLPVVPIDQIIEEIKSMVSNDLIAVIYVGLPKHLSGAEGASAAHVRKVSEALAEQVEVPIRLVDERLTTKSAMDIIRQRPELAGSDLDSVAALSILEFALAGERNRGEFFGYAL
jgi:putative Holliday junction resolvase